MGEGGGAGRREEWGDEGGGGEEGRTVSEGYPNTSVVLFDARGAVGGKGMNSDHVGLLIRWEVTRVIQPSQRFAEIVS